MRTYSGLRARTLGSLAAVLVGTGLAAGVSLGPAATAGVAAPSAAPAVAASSIPPELAVPAGNKLVAVLPALGVQVYQCTSGAWTFLEPAAQLFDGIRPAAIHFRGPSWESTRDGSLVTGRVVTSLPVTGSIPQLLLAAATTRGDGLFGHVTFIQRLATTGGAMPTGACTDGATQAVRYTARYLFYTAA
jgi:Protein of unknown function (DUF3455)